MFGIGLPEMILIMALALIVVGPDKLPDLARSIAKGVLELKKTVATLKENFAEDNPFDSVKPELEEAAKSLKNQLGEPDPDGWKSVMVDSDVTLPEKQAAETSTLPQDDKGDTRQEETAVHTPDDLESSAERAVSSSEGSSPIGNEPDESAAPDTQGVEDQADRNQAG